MQKIGVIYAIILGFVTLIFSGCNRSETIDENVINSYLTINSGVKTEIENMCVVNNDLYSIIYAKAVERPAKYSTLKEETSIFEKDFNDIYNCIRRVKVICLHKNDDSIDVNNIDSDTCACKDPYDTNSAYSVMCDGMGDSIKIWVDNFRSKVLKMSIFEDRFGNIDTKSDIYKKVETILSTSNNESKIQCDYTCVKNIPVIGALSLLSELQMAIKSVESIVLRQIIAKMEGIDVCIPIYNFDYIACVVNSGREYEARIYAGFCDTTMKQTIYMTHTAPFYDSVVRYDGKIEYKLLDNAKYDILQSDKQGRGIYKDDGKEPGVHEYGGLILYKTNYGDVWIPFRSAYIISK